jgi:spermidine synthase
VTTLLWPCFALSGAAALALELLWIRSAGLVLGTTAATAGAVVASYFAGLAAGGFLARRPSSLPVRRYALLELAVAGGALLSYGIFRLLAADGAQRALDAAGAGGRLAVVAISIIPVTIALGATLPTLCQVLAAPGTVGPRGGTLYALNTVGGAAGVAVMGFGLPSVIGVTACYFATAATSAVASLLALWVGDGPSKVPAPASTTDGPTARWLWAVAAVTGFMGMGLEILWVVLFAQVLHNSVYSFAAVSLVFLLALAAGAEVSALLLRRLPPLRIAAGGLLVCGVATVAGVWTFVRLTSGLQYVGMQTGLAEYIGRILGLVALTAGPGTVAAGAVLPALWTAFGDRHGASHPVGELTGANLLGGAVGALAMAFVVLPLIGLRAGFLLAAVLALVLAAALAGGAASLRAVAYAGLLAVVIADPMHAPLTRLNTGETLRAVSEGAAGIVTVVDAGGDVQLRLDNYYVLGGSAAERNERRQGLLPLLLHPDPQRVAFIGMATGISASAATATGVRDTTVIEVVPEVATLARRHFARWNGGLLDRSDVRLVVDDGRRHLGATGETFDVIVSDLFIPWHASAGNLYSLEMYQTVARRLAPGGLFCQWLPMYQLTREEFEVIARTFLAAFPHTTLWRNDFYPNRPVLGLVGARHPITVNLERVGRRLAGLPAWGRDSLLGAPRSIGMLYVGDLSAAPDLIARAPLNLDGYPVIEFTAPRLTRMNAQGDKDWLTGAALAEYTEALAARLAGRPEPALPPTEEMAQARRAGAALFRYAIAATQGDTGQAQRLMREISLLVPDVIAGVEGEAPAVQIAEVQRSLGQLQSDQERLRQQLQSVEQRLRSTPTSGERR